MFSDRHERYVVQQGHNEPREVDLATFLELEGRAGFQPRVPGCPATGSFSDSVTLTQGRVVHSDDEFAEALKRYRIRPMLRQE